MAIKIKKRRPQSEEPETEVVEGEESVDTDAPLALPEPQMHDTVLDNSRTAFQWLYEHRNVVISGIAVFLIIAGVLSLVASSKRSAQAAESSRLFTALQTAEAPVTGDDAVYSSVAEREAALASAASALTTSDSPVVGRFAHALAGRAALAEGDAAAALAAMQHSAPTGPTAESVILKVSLATAQAEAGDLSAALETLDDAASADSPFAPAIARARVRLIDAFGERADALAAYREYLDAYPLALEPESLEARMAALEMETGAEPRAEAGESSGGLPEAQ